MTPVIALSCTLSIHHHLFFFLFQKLSNKAYIFFLLMHDTPMKKSSPFNTDISFAE
jgi:hypothetical protein